MCWRSWRKCTRKSAKAGARWISFLVQRTPECFAAGEAIFGDALFAPYLAVEPDGTFEILVSPEAREGEVCVLAGSAPDTARA